MYLPRMSTQGGLPVSWAFLIVPAVLSAFWGWQKGAMRVASRLSVLVLAYALAWQETPALVHLLAEKQWLSGMYIWPVAGGALFMGGSLVFSLAAVGLIYLAPDEWKEGGKGAGALLGALLGGVIGLFLVWTVGVAQDAIHKREQTKGSAATTSQPAPVASRSASDQFLHDFAANTVAGTVTTIMGDSPATALTSEVLRAPLSVGEGFKHLAEQPDLRLLIQDPQSYAVLMRGTPAEIMRLPHFRAVVADAELMRFLESTGLSGDTPVEQEQDLANKLSTYARNFEYIRQTPEYQALAADPDFQSQLKSGQWLQLLGNDRVRELAEMLINPDTVVSRDTVSTPPAGFTMQAPGQAQWVSPDQAESEAAPEGNDTGTAPAKTIYRWRDADGRMHLSDEKPPEGTPADVLVE